MEGKLPKLTKQNCRGGRSKKKTRDFVKEWRENRRKEYKEKRKKAVQCPECKKELPKVYPQFISEGKEICFECGTDIIKEEKAVLELRRIRNKAKERNDYGYYLWRQQI